MAGQIDFAVKTTFFLAAGLAVLMLLEGCAPPEAPKARPPVPVVTARAITTNVLVRIEPAPVGHVMPYSTVTVHSQIGGTISGVHFQEGQEVKQGALLFTIDPRPSQAALDQARAALKRDTAQLEYATLNFDREQKLFDQKLISRDELDTTRASMDGLKGTVQLDQAAITNALLNLEFCEVRAPMDAKTGRLCAYLGNVVKAPDDTLVTLNQIRPIYAQFGVPEQFLPEIKRQMRQRKLAVAATFAGLDGPAPEGELTFVDNAVDTTTGMIQLKAAFANADDVLWPGQYVQLQLTLSELRDVVAVPTQAVQTGQNGQYTYVVKADGTAEQRPIVTGVDFQGLTVVKQGLQAGETVVTDGQLRLVPGAAVSDAAKPTAEATASGPAK
jgi:multidrug efflux system membrane fusion protein